MLQVICWKRPHMLSQRKWLLSEKRATKNTFVSFKLFLFNGQICINVYTVCAGVCICMCMHSRMKSTALILLTNVGSRLLCNSCVVHVITCHVAHYAFIFLNPFDYTHDPGLF